MKHAVKVFVLLVAFVCSWAVAQEEPHQVPGFPAFSPAPTMLEVVEDKGDTVVVRHAFGETEISKNPQRVHAEANMEIPLSLGLNVVSGIHLSSFAMPPALAEAAQDTDILDFTEAPNLEFILSKQPDLILEWHYTGDRQRYEQLSRIAPTIVYMADPFAYWQQATRDLAAVLGIEERAEELVQQYEESISVQCNRIREIVSNETVNVFTVYERTLNLIPPVYEDGEGNYVPNVFAVWAYRDCRLTPGDEVSHLAGVTGGATLSLELLPELQADHFFICKRLRG